MKNSHAAVLVRKGFNYGVWFGLLLVKNKVSKSLWIIYWIIMNVGDQNALQEQPLNNHKVGFLERQCISVMNYSAQSNIEHEQPKQSSCHLTQFFCLSASTDENCGETSCQELNQGKCKSDTPCLMQRVWVQEWTWKKSQSNMNSWQL